MRAGETLKAAERAAEVKALRGCGEGLVNEHLEAAGVSGRIDMRSHAEQGTGLDSEVRQLPSQWRAH